MVSPITLKKELAKGNNLLKSLKIFIEKKFYYDEVYPDGSSPWVTRPIDFINENPLYGKVDMQKNFIYPRPEKLRPLNVESSAEDTRVLRFVADAFEDLKRYINAHLANGYLLPTGIVAECDPKQTFFSLLDKYDMYRELHYGHFTLLYLAFSSETQAHRKFPPGKKIIGFPDFMKYFKDFLKASGAIIPFTPSALVASGNLSPLYTGLCIEIHDAKYDDDAAKHAFINHANFSFFQLAARKHGFFLDRNVPWRLVADVTSYKMREYARIDYEKPLVSDILKNIHDGLEEDLKKMLPTPAQIHPNFSDETWSKISAAEAALQVRKDFEAAKAAMVGGTDIQEKTELQTFKGPKDPEYTIEYDLDLIFPFNVKKNELCEEETGNCISRIFTLEALFEEYYENVHVREPMILRYNMWRYWTSYLFKNPTAKISETVGCTQLGVKTSVVKEVDRKSMSWEEFKEEYGDLFWLKTYLDVRILENNIAWSKEKYDRKLKKAFIAYKVLDFDEAVAYINDEVKKGLLGYADIYKEKEQFDSTIATIMPLGATLPAGKSY